MDLLLGSVFLVLSLPLVLVAAIVIRLESPGSPLFFQRRLGMNGEPFRIFKLRGMYADARERYPHLYDYSTKPDLDFHFHEERDPRLTRVGRCTRKNQYRRTAEFLERGGW